MKPIYFCVTVFLSTLIPRVCQGGNILVCPVEGSHWINMDILLKALHARGHNITVVRSSQSWYIPSNSSYYSTISVGVERSLTKQQVTKFVSQIIECERGEKSFMKTFRLSVTVVDIMIDYHKIVGEFVSTMLGDHKLMRTMKDSKFDLLLTDPAWGTGVILSKYLNLPLVYNVRWLLFGEAHLAIAPSPLSYIPVVGSGKTDKMNFVQRVQNVVVHLFNRILSNLVVKLIYSKICDKYLEPGTDYYQHMLNADIWLMRTDFVFDYPRPTMPNAVYIGGFQCKPAKPLPLDLEEFVQTSGEHGFIVMSLGTFVSALPADIADEIAAAFAKLPQKVIWKHEGDRPASLGNNTLLVDWMPQNDLLGHPKIKLLVAHGGTNGVQEAICHGVPVVGLPVFFDQYDNLIRLEDKGAAKILTLATVDRDNFLEGVEEVLNVPSYRTNMRRLSWLHRDQPMSPMESALFWIEFVMRHKGASHLKAESYRLPWYVYHSVDVFLFLSAVVLLVVLSIFTLMRCCYYATCQRKIKKD